MLLDFLRKFHSTGLFDLNVTEYFTLLSLMLDKHNSLPNVLTQLRSIIHLFFIFHRHSHINVNLPYNQSIIIILLTMHQSTTFSQPH